MAIKFTKMHGLGNDFVVMDNISHSIFLTEQTIQQMADRHTGIGFDQLLLIEAAHQPGIDFLYRIFNANGKEAEQCGNGARCIAKYLHDNHLITRNEVNVLTKAGVLKLKIQTDGMVTVNMGVPNFDPKLIPLSVTVQKNHYEILVDEQTIQFGAVSLGNPHAVIFVNDVAQAKVNELGSFMQYHHLFPKQVNVGFLQFVDRGHLKLRVFERGAGETLACGTGACAAMAIARKQNLVDEDVKIDLPGGQLKLTWASEKDPIFLTGPAETTFLGEWLI